jgi:regulator of RNase E activity RraA
MPLDTATLAARLSRLSTALASDLLKGESLMERAGPVLTAMTPPEPGTSIAGPVLTVQFLPGRPELRERKGPPLNFEIVDGLQPHEVLVLAAGGSLKGAVLGDMIATRALHLGCGGVLADGAVRDLDDLADVGLPVMAAGIAPMAAHATLVPVASRCPVRFGEVTVLPEDWVLADRNGTLFLPRALAELAVERQEEAALRERFSRSLLEAGFRLTEVFPLPASLTPFLDAFRNHGTVPAAEAVRKALAAG